VDWPVHGPPLGTEAQAIPHQRRTYAVELVAGYGLADRPLDWYTAQGFEYLIVTSYISQLAVADPEGQRARAEFYAALDSRFELMQVFAPCRGNRDCPFTFDDLYGPFTDLWARQRPGPTIKIYLIRGDHT
jgi:hypothetical protein